MGSGGTFYEEGVGRGNTLHFGYKVHIGVDKNTGLVQTLKTTAVNVHDVTMIDVLLNGEEETVYEDSGCLGAEKREDTMVRNLKYEKIYYKINRPLF